VACKHLRQALILGCRKNNMIICCSSAGVGLGLTQPTNYQHPPENHLFFSKFLTRRSRTNGMGTNPWPDTRIPSVNLKNGFRGMSLCCAISNCLQTDSQNPPKIENSRFCRLVLKGTSPFVGDVGWGVSGYRNK